MSFFDKKEEVLDIELTQYGKHLLSKGKFKPVYYAFFDDDVIYDSEYGGFQEAQSETTDRVKDETANVKAQHVHYGVEQNFEKSKQLLRIDKEPLAQQLQMTADKNFVFVAPLGNSQLSDQYAPAWSLSFLKGELTGAVTYKTGSHGSMRVPQLETKVVTFYTKPEKPEIGEDSELPSLDDSKRKPRKPLAQLDLDRGSEASDLNFAISRFEDGSYIKVEDDFILISVDEENSPLLSKNYDIEVFIEEIDQKTGQEVLTPLFFDKRRELIDENNVLLDQEDLEASRLETLGSEYVNHFFHVYVDQEISKDVLCKLLPKSEREAMFPTDYLDCDDVAGNAVDTTGLYDSDISPEDIEDDC
jgi:hypothetical protein